MPASECEIAEHLRIWILTTLFQPQDHFPAVSHVPVGKLVDTNFHEIDISNPTIRYLGQLAGFEEMPGDLALGSLLQRLNAACNPKTILDGRQIKALINLSSSLINEDDAWNELRSLWKFFSKAELPQLYDLGSAPVIDPLCNLIAPPRYKLKITCFQYIDDYDEETGEALCHIDELSDPLYTDSLDTAVSQVRPACQRAIDDMIKGRRDSLSFLKFAQIFEGEKLILSIQYNVPDDCQKANKKGLDGYTLSSNRLFTSGLSATLASSLKREFGRSFFDKVSENNLARDLGL